MKIFFVLLIVYTLLCWNVHCTTNRKSQLEAAANAKPTMTDITMVGHVRVEDIRFIYFTPDKVLDKEKEIFIICKTMQRSNRPPQRMTDYDYFCFSSIEGWDVEVTNASHIDCVMDDFAGSDVVHVSNPVRDHSCTIDPIFANATPEDRERMLSYLKTSNWICDHIDCMHNNITMFEILDHSLDFKNSQFVLGNQHPKIKLIWDLIQFIKDI